MLDTPHAAALAAALGWLMIMTAATLKTGGLTIAGIRVGLSNRDALAEPTPLAGRADRAAKNMLENLVLFGLVLLAALGNAGDAKQVQLGANLFLAARALYFPVYLAGITGVRTALWAAGVAGMALIGAAAF